MVIFLNHILNIIKCYTHEFEDSFENTPFELVMAWQHGPDVLLFAVQLP
jgi:hypothetical protein